MMSLQWGCRCKMLFKFDSRINALVNNNNVAKIVASQRYLSNTSNNNDNNNNSSNNSGNNNNNNISNNINNRKDKLKVLRCLASTTNAIHIHQKAVGSIIEDPFLNVNLWSQADRGHCWEAKDYGVNVGSAVPQRPGKKDFEFTAKVAKDAKEVVSPSEMIKDADVLDTFLEQVNVTELMKWYDQLENEQESTVPIHVCKKVIEALSTNDADSTIESGMFAMRVFECVRDVADAETYNSYIISLLNCKDMDMNKHAYTAYLEMCSKKMKGTLQMYNGVLRQVLYSLNGHARRDIVKSIISELVHYNIKPDVNTFIFLMHDASHQKDGATDEVWRLKREMVALDIAPTFGVYYYLIKSLLDKYQGSRMGQKMWVKIYFEGILDEIESGNINGEGRERSDKLCFEVMLEAGSQFGLKELTERLVRCMLDNKSIIPWEYNFGHLIEHMRKSRRHTSDDIIQVYKDIVPTCYKPDGRTYVKLMLAMAEKGDFQHFPALFEDYEALCIPMYLSSMNALVSMMTSQVPVEQRPHLLKVAENAYQRFKRHPQFIENAESILTGFIYFRALNKQGIEGKLSDCLDAELCISTILTNVIQTCLQDNEQEAATLIRKTAAQKQIQLNVQSATSKQTTNVVEKVGKITQFERELNIA